MTSRRPPGTTAGRRPAVRSVDSGQHRALAAPAQSTGGRSAAVHPAPTQSRPLAPLDRFMVAAEAWASTAGRILLGAVLAWFGYHELVAPGTWTGYVPVLSATSHFTEVLVLAHGWTLLVLAAALVVGVAPRLAAAAAAVLLLEIVISLTVSGGLSDLVLRDVGVLGLSIAIVGTKCQRFILQR